MDSENKNSEYCSATPIAESSTSDDGGGYRNKRMRWHTLTVDSTVFI